MNSWTWLFITIGIIVFGAVIELYFLQQKTKKERTEIMEFALTAIKDFLYNLLVEAEKVWGKKTGAIKQSYVIGLVINSQFYISLPNYVKVIVNSVLIGKLIDDMVDKVLKPAMNDNKELQAKIRNN